MAREQMTGVASVPASLPVGVPGFMPVEQPLDLRATLESGQAFRWRWDGQRYWGVVGQQAFALSQVEGGLLFRSSAPSPEIARAALSDYFRLDDDLYVVCREMATDERLAEAVSRYRGLRLLRQDPWECLISFVCSSVSNIPRITRNLHDLAETYGEVVALEGRRFRLFPEPARLAQAGEEALTRLGLGFRAGYVARIARLRADGKLDLLALRHAPYDGAKAALMELPGIGDKVADCILVFSLEKLEGFPIDRWVRRALVEWYGQSEKARYRDLLAWAQARWGRHAGYVQQYLFHHRRLMAQE